MKKSKKSILLIILGIFSTLLILFFCYKSIPFMRSLKDPVNQHKFEKYISNLGWKGYLALLAIQIMQIFIAFIPGEIVEILSGMLYGYLGGLFICLFGILIGSLLIYFFMKFIANNYILKYKEKFKTYSFLNNPKKIHTYLFILFLIPGIPKDIFIYFAPFLPIKFSDFLIISLIARIPSILSSTVIGDSFISGNYITSIIIFLVFGVFGILGIVFNDKIVNLFSKHNKSENTSHKIINNDNTIEN